MDNATTQQGTDAMTDFAAFCRVTKAIISAAQERRLLTRYNRVRGNTQDAVYCVAVEVLEPYMCDATGDMTPDRGESIFDYTERVVNDVFEAYDLNQ